MTKAIKISEVTRAILALTDIIPGLGKDQFLTELASMFGTQRFMTQAQVAEMFAVSPQTVLFWRKEGMLQPALVVRGKKGCTGCIRFSMKDVSDFIADQFVTSQSGREDGEDANKG